MYFALAIFSIYISAKDLKSHRISNRSLFLGASFFLILTIVQGGGLHWISALLTLALAPITIAAKVGAGDIKLASLLALFFLPPTIETLVDFSLSFTILSSALVALTIAKERSLRKSIALAPAICGAVIWCAR